MNVVVLQGVLSRTPEIRELSSGSTLVSFDVSTPTDEGMASVPVAWFDPRTTAVFDAGDEVVVVGQVRRRFFRSGAATQSRTEVVAQGVVRARQRRAVERLLVNAAQALEGSKGA